MAGCCKVILKRFYILPALWRRLAFGYLLLSRELSARHVSVDPKHLKCTPDG